MSHTTTPAVGTARLFRRGRVGGALLLWTLVPALCAAQLSATAQREIDGLLRAVGGSGCLFLRGGTAHPAAEAQKHLQKKYEYLASRSKMASAEDFIELAGTNSSMSGEPYTIRCGESPLVPSGDWLRARLRLIRQAHAPR